MPVSRPAVIAGYQPNQQRFNPSCPIRYSSTRTISPGGVPAVASSLSDIRRAKNFVYAYSQQANLTFEQDLGHDLALSVAYNFNGGPPPESSDQCEHRAWRFAGEELAGGDRGRRQRPRTTALFQMAVGVLRPGPVCAAPALMNFFRPSGLNPVNCVPAVWAESRHRGGACRPCVPLA